MSDLGPLTPEPIKIPKGDVIGRAKLVATRPGTVNVWYIYSTPSATVTDPPLTIEYTQPVWGPALVPAEPTVALFDYVDVAVELVDGHGTSVPADEDRPVYISVGTGAGKLSTTEVKFAPNESRQLTRFMPTRPGKVHLVATTPSLPRGGADIDVQMPWGLLGLCGLGSLLGALLAYWTKKGEKTWQRFIIGLITGSVLYLTLLFFGEAVGKIIPHAALLNPFVALLVPFFGGWGGTPVIAWLVRKLGFDW